MMDAIAEQRILEALRRGEFDDLPGKGRRLCLDDDAMVPATLRPAYRILRNAGFVPPELDARREIRALEDLLATVAPKDAADPEIRRARRRLTTMRMRLEAARGSPSRVSLLPEYQGRLLSRLAPGD